MGTVSEMAGSQMSQTSSSSQLEPLSPTVETTALTRPYSNLIHSLIHNLVHEQVLSRSPRDSHGAHVPTSHAGFLGGPNSDALNERHARRRLRSSITS